MVQFCFVILRNGHCLEIDFDPIWNTPKNGILLCGCHKCLQKRALRLVCEGSTLSVEDGDQEPDEHENARLRFPCGAIVLRTYRPC